MTRNIKVLSPAIDGITPGIPSRGKTGNYLQTMGSRVEAVDCIILATARPMDRLHLGVMKHALLHVESSPWPPDEIVDRVVTILASKAMQENSLLVSPAIAIGVSEKNKVGLL